MYIFLGIEDTSSDLRLVCFVRRQGRGNFVTKYIPQFSVNHIVYCSATEECYEESRPLIGVFEAPPGEETTSRRITLRSPTETAESFVSRLKEQLIIESTPVKVKYVRRKMKNPDTPLVTSVNPPQLIFYQKNRRTRRQSTLKMKAHLDSLHEVEIKLPADELSGPVLFEKNRISYENNWDVEHFVDRGTSTISLCHYREEVVVAMGDMLREFLETLVVREFSISRNVSNQMSKGILDDFRDYVTGVEVRIGTETSRHILSLSSPHFF
eukprot:sb/3468237/